MEKLMYVVWGDGGAEAGDGAAGPPADRGRAEPVRGRRPRADGRRARRRGRAGAAADADPRRRGLARRDRLGVDRRVRPARAVRARARRPRPDASPATSSSSPSTTTTAPPQYSGPRDWPDGERSPGVLTVALIHRPEGLVVRRLDRAWHGTQSPLSAELQPRTRYVRNEVVRAGHRRRARGERDRRGGVGVDRGRGRPDAVLQLRRRPRRDAGERRRRCSRA